MNPYRRTLVAALATPALAALTGGTAHAQMPTGTIRIVVPFPPGQGADTIMRMVAEAMGRRTKQPVIIDNRPGAGGALGTEYAAKQPPDGLTLLMGSSGTMSISPTLQPQAVRYDPLKDFEFITGVASVAQVFVVSAASPIKDLAGLIQAARQAPGRIAFGSSGIGTTQHLFMEAFAHTAGIKMLHVPYKGAAPAFNDLVGGQIQLISDTIPALLQHIKAGTVRALAVTSARRFGPLPDVPTVGETFPGFQAVGWVTVVAPAGVPAPMADRLAAEIRAAMAEPDVAGKVRDMGFVPMDETRNELRGFITAELQKWKTVIDAAGIKAQ